MFLMVAQLKRSCVLSKDGAYRYRLEEVLPTGTGALCWIMINPSTADAITDDQTIRKVRGFTERAGYAMWIVVNLFAFRAKSIKDCRDARVRGQAVGNENDRYIIEATTLADDVVCAWGPKPWAYGRAHLVVDMLRNHPVAKPRLLALGFAQDGAPLHPLTLGYDRKLVPFTEAT